MLLKLKLKSTEWVRCTQTQHTYVVVYWPTITNLNSYVHCKTDFAQHRVRRRLLHNPVRRIVAAGQYNFDSVPCVQHHTNVYILTKMTIQTNPRLLSILQEMNIKNFTVYKAL